MIIDGFAIVGNADSVDRAYAEAADPNDPRIDGAGIDFSSTDPARPAHHVGVRNDDVALGSANGVSLRQMDWVTVERNVVRDNARCSKYGASRSRFFEVRGRRRHGVREDRGA